MNTLIKRLLCAATVAAVPAAGLAGGSADPNLGMVPNLANSQFKNPAQVKINKAKIRPGALQIACPNPALHSLRPMVISQTRNGATIQITAIVRNVGAADYVSNPGQQHVILLMDGQPVAQRDFPRLSRGQQMTLAWHQDISRYGYGEFTPVFEARLGFDPDIRLDGNPSNDDCRMTDNRKRLNGQTINAMLAE